ncbi:MAG: hypothetical protein BWY66_00975 [bacterium ADurb.Bin374]|nr:MAG: hypothetical protein BWY66_00975 [bacterium ADurb.Bin374]
MLRFLSRMAAMIIDGPETSSIRPKIASGICHQERARKPVTTLAIAVPIAPIANPIAANIPANLPTSNACGAAGGPPAADAAAVWALSAAPAIPPDSFSCIALSPAPANFSTCSVIIRPIRR